MIELHYKKLYLCHVSTVLSLLRYLKRNSQAVLTRAQMNQDGPSPKFLRLYEYLPREVQTEVAPVSFVLLHCLP